MHTCWLLGLLLFRPWTCKLLGFYRRYTCAAELGPGHLVLRALAGPGKHYYKGLVPRGSFPRFHPIILRGTLMVAPRTAALRWVVAQLPPTPRSGVPACQREVDASTFVPCACVSLPCAWIKPCLISKRNRCNIDPFYTYPVVVAAPPPHPCLAHRLTHMSRSVQAHHCGRLQGTLCAFMKLWVTRIQRHSPLLELGAGSLGGSVLAWVPCLCVATGQEIIPPVAPHPAPSWPAPKPYPMHVRAEDIT
jgi:hypothetical protein